MGKISIDRWQRAQIAERRYHTEPKEVLVDIYSDAYSQYFEWLGISHNLDGKTIIEVGCADVPALHYCNNYNNSIVIEPMDSSVLEELCEGNPITIIKEPVEGIELDENHADEVWLFNVMQHIIDPDVFVEKCKKWGRSVKFFEPINMGTTEAHPQSYTLEDFVSWFGDCVNFYDYNNDAKNFHQNQCAYGVWTS